MKIIQQLKWRLNNQSQRDDFVVQKLKEIAPDSLLLDAGAGSQRYRQHCHHLKYFAQDFVQYTQDKRDGFTDRIGGQSGYAYGKMDYIGDIWNIAEKSAHFDTILCTEVFEHIPFPVETVREFSRLLKPGGTLILTAPFSCLRHMDPFFFYTGFSDNFYQRVLGDHGFEIKELIPVGDYYRCMAVEMLRTAASHSIFTKIALLPAILYFLAKKPTQRSVNSLCMSYHVTAVRT